MTIRAVQSEITLPSGHREAITTRDAVAMMKQVSELLVGVNLTGTVLERAAEVCGCRTEDIFTNKRPEHIVLARWLVWEHMRDVEHVRPYKIATLTGYDHGTVRNAFHCLSELRRHGKPWQRAAIDLFWQGQAAGRQSKPLISNPSTMHPDDLEIEYLTEERMGLLLDGRREPTPEEIQAATMEAMATVMRKNQRRWNETKH